MAILHEHIEGKYEILGKLGEGGMGAVYKVRHRLLDEIRVVKVLNPRLDATPELNDRFLREARFAIQLRHPNIAQLHDFSIAEDGSAFIVMEHIDGATLEDVLARSGPPPLGLGLEIARQSLKAIGFLHRKGLIHRDISPDNLMLARDPDGEPLIKLIDLGIAKGLQAGSGQLTSTGMFLGKPRYASPEQFGVEGLAGIDSRADLYSFGVVLYELLTGVCPIQGRDPSSLMAGHLFRPPVDFAVSDPQGRLPSDLRAILLRTLAKNPDERYASAEELGLALKEVQARYPLTPGDLDAVLLAATSTAEPPIPDPGSTQDKLDQHFAKVPTPAPTLRSEPRRDSTLVLTPPPFAVVRDRTEAPSVSREPTPPPEVTAPPPPPPQPVRMEMPTPPRRLAPEPPRRRSLLPIAALVVLGLAAAGWGVWWWTRPAPMEPPTQPTAPAPAPLSVTTTEAQSAPPVSPEPVPSVAPPTAAEPVGSTAAPAVAPSPSPAAVAKKSPSRPERRELGSVPDASPTPQPAAKKEQTQPLPEPAAPAPSNPAPPSVPTPARPSEERNDQKVDIAARLISVPSPSLPALYKGDQAYVRIVVAVRVNEEGKVTETRIKDSHIDSSSRTPTMVIYEAALEAAGKGLFQPAQRDGRPVAYWTGLTFEWGRKSGQSAPAPVQPAAPIRAAQSGAVISDPQEKPDVKAQLISAPLPSYQKLSTNARFIVAVLVNEHGVVIQSRIQDFSSEVLLESSLVESLRGPVLQAANQALFRPALRKGKPVASWTNLDFKLSPKP